MPQDRACRRTGHLRLVLDEHELERRVLAEELHEQVAQALAAILVGLDDLASRGQCADWAARLASVRGQAQDTLEHCRALAVALSPPLLGQFGLVYSIDRLALRAGVKRVRIDPALADAPLGPALEAEVYRFVERVLAGPDRVSSLSVSLDRFGGEVLVATDRGTAAFPQSGRVDIPDGARRALP